MRLFFAPWLLLLVGALQWHHSLLVLSLLFQPPSHRSRHVHRSVDSFLNGRRDHYPMTYFALEEVTGVTTTSLFHYRGRRLSSSGSFPFIRSRIASKSPYSNLVSRTGFFRQCSDRLLAPLLRMYKYLFRRFLQRYTVYVLECNNNKYYVGSTSKRRQRFREHTSSRGGSAWTRMHRPVRVLREYRNIPPLYVLGMEASVTAHCMLEFGIQNVRGAMFSEPRVYTMEDSRALTGFIGHYNELDYKEVALRVERELFSLEEYRRGTTDHANDKKKRKRKKKRMLTTKSNDRCFNCGERGHWASECPNMWGSWNNNSGSTVQL